MARFRLSRPAQADLANILVTSAERWGSETRGRYAALLAAAMKMVAADPEGGATKSRPELLPGIRSFHIRHARNQAAGGRVRKPVHVVYYRVVTPGLVEIVRLLHERMQPSKYIAREFEEN